MKTVQQLLTEWGLNEWRPDYDAITQANHKIRELLRKKPGYYYPEYEALATKDIAPSGKDTQRVRSILASPNQTGAAEKMANSIDDPFKAVRRMAAAENLREIGIAAIFAQRALELMNEDLTTGDKWKLESAFKLYGRKIGADQMDSEPSHIGKTSSGNLIYQWGYRVYDLYRARRGEEDDDWPEFVGYNKALTLAKQVFAGIPGVVNIEVGDQEKSWFDVIIEIKP